MKNFHVFHIIIHRAARNSSKSQDNGIDKSAKFRSTGVSGYGDVSGVLLKDSYGNIAKGSDAYGSLADYGHLGLESMIQGKIQQHSNAIPISEHVEVTRPVAVPIYKDIGKYLSLSLSVRRLYELIN